MDENILIDLYQRLLLAPTDKNLISQLKREFLRRNLDTVSKTFDFYYYRALKDLTFIPAYGGSCNNFITGDRIQVRTIRIISMVNLCNLQIKHADTITSVVIDVNMLAHCLLDGTLEEISESEYCAESLSENQNG